MKYPDMLSLRYATMTTPNIVDDPAFQQRSLASVEPETSVASGGASHLRSTRLSDTRSKTNVRPRVNLRVSQKPPQTEQKSRRNNASAGEELEQLQLRDQSPVQQNMGTYMDAPLNRNSGKNIGRLNTGQSELEKICKFAIFRAISFI